MEETYPNPRQRKNIPLWILVSLMLQLKLNQSNSFLQLPGILKSGAILTRTSFNIGTIQGGFNRRNRYPVPLDKHHRYVDVKKLGTEEAKKFKYTLAYKMVNLLHLSAGKDYFTFFGTEISGVATHDKVLGKALVDNFVAKIGKGKIKTLIADRGFLDKVWH